MRLCVKILMSQPVEISVVRDTAGPAIAKLIASTTPRALGEVVWPPALELTQRHLTAYKNKKGFPSQGFGEQLADKTFGTSTDTGAKLVIHGQGARALYYGATIKPVNKKILCFGITADSYGKSLPEMFGGAIPPAGQRSAADKAKLKALRPMFMFAASVTIQPHTDLIPSPGQYQATAVKAMRNAIWGGFN